MLVSMLSSVSSRREELLISSRVEMPDPALEAAGETLASRRRPGLEQAGDLVAQGTGLAPTTARPHAPTRPRTGGSASALECAGVRYWRPPGRPGPPVPITMPAALAWRLVAALINWFLKGRGARRRSGLFELRRLTGVAAGGRDASWRLMGTGSRLGVSMWQRTHGRKFNRKRKSWITFLGRGPGCPVARVPFRRISDCAISAI